MLGEFSKQKFQILVGVEIVGIGCFDNAVKHLTGLCTVVGFHDDEVLSPQSKRADCLRRESME